MGWAIIILNWRILLSRGKEFPTMLLKILERLLLKLGLDLLLQILKKAFLFNSKIGSVKVTLDCSRISPQMKPSHISLKIAISFSSGGFRVTKFMSDVLIPSTFGVSSGVNFQWSQFPSFVTLKIGFCRFISEVLFLLAPTLQPPQGLTLNNVN